METKNPLDVLAYQYDIVCNGVELSSGAVRNHDMQIMVKAFEIAGYDEETLKSKFGALYQAFHTMRSSSVHHHTQVWHLVLTE